MDGTLLWYLTFPSLIGSLLWFWILPYLNSFPTVRWRPVGPRDVEIPAAKNIQKTTARPTISTDKHFVYEEAFDRTIGWVTSAELQTLRRCRVAIGGLGGVGGAHALALARLGVGRFTISDMDTFDWPNMNRQAGCFLSTIGKSKGDTIASMLLDINPEIQVTVIPKFIDSSNVDQFLEGVDLFIDAYDFFCSEIREITFQRCHHLGIPAITSAPVGFGASLACFLPNGMTFEEYFNFEGAKTPFEKAVHFLAGISPNCYHGRYIADRTRVNLPKKQVCSTAAGINLSSGMIAAYAIKILLGRGPIITVPSTLHFDAFRNDMAITWRPWGNKNPWQRLLIQILLKFTSHSS